jgi:CheY-like chemotaxis protein
MAHQTGNRKPKMLIADDDLGIVTLLAERCADMGFAVETASNGVQALIMARRNQPDILIIDVNMPEVDGISVCSRLREARSTQLAMVVVTGSSNPKTIKQCERLGAFYVLKASDFWGSIALALTHTFPDMADKIKELAISSVGAEIRKRPRALLVYDDPETNKFLYSRLAKCGVDLLHAADVVQAYRIACKEHPSVIISDLYLAKSDIHYLLWRLRSTKVTANVPVFVMTGRQLDEPTKQDLRREICGRPGVARVFEKPFDTVELIDALQKVCGLENRRNVSDASPLPFLVQVDGAALAIRNSRN